ncbi:MAG: hypothetical protein ACHBN1_14070 [Heteroscytonema crispum UTEX LB 1556]
MSGVNLSSRALRLIVPAYLLLFFTAVVLAVVVKTWIEESLFKDVMARWQS